jgi:hypothetical protein
MIESDRTLPAILISSSIILISLLKSLSSYFQPSTSSIRGTVMALVASPTGQLLLYCSSLDCSKVVRKDRSGVWRIKAENSLSA